MKRTFISYRHRPSDANLAKDLASYLQSRGISVFIDAHIEVGESWPEEIKEHLLASDIFVVFLSKSSIKSQAVRYELFCVSELQKKGKKIKILPVFLGSTTSQDLPVDMAYGLHPIQHITWQVGKSRDHLYSSLYAAISKRDESPSPDDEIDARPEAVAPFPRAGHELPVEPETGTIRPESRFYVLRKADSDIETLLRFRGVTILLRGPGQSGKSSCLLRANSIAKSEYKSSLYVDLSTFVDKQLTSLDVLLQRLARYIVQTQEVSLKVEWDPEEGSKENFSNFLEACILPDRKTPLCLILDGVDILLDYPYHEDFFTAVRDWHNRRAVSDCWNNLNIIIGHVSDPIFWTTRANAPVFNVGKRIWLDDFSLDQVERMNDIYGSPLRGGAQIRNLLRLIGGHPFLVRQALYTLCTEKYSLAHLKRDAIRAKGPFGDHLRAITWTLLKKGELRAEVLNLITGKSCSDENNFQQLLAAGIVSGESRNDARLRCDLYQVYFSKHL